MKTEKKIKNNICQCLNNCKVKIIAGAVLGIILGAVLCCALCPKNKIAFVDLQKIVENSKSVVNLKQEREMQIAALQEWVKGPVSEIEKEKNAKKKEELSQKYQQELAVKSQAIQNQYLQNLAKIDAELTAIIATVATEEGFSLTLNKTSVLTGGTDITDKVIQKVK